MHHTARTIRARACLSGTFESLLWHKIYVWAISKDKHTHKKGAQEAWNFIFREGNTPRLVPEEQHEILYSSTKFSLFASFIFHESLTRLQSETHTRPSNSRLKKTLILFSPKLHIGKIKCRALFFYFLSSSFLASYFSGYVLMAYSKIKLWKDCNQRFL